MGGEALAPGRGSRERTAPLLTLRVDLGARERLGRPPRRARALVAVHQMAPVEVGFAEGDHEVLLAVRAVQEPAAGHEVWPRADRPALAYDVGVRAREGDVGYAGHDHPHS